MLAREMCICMKARVEANEVITFSWNVFSYSLKDFQVFRNLFQLCKLLHHFFCIQNKMFAFLIWEIVSPALRIRIRFTKLYISATHFSAKYMNTIYAVFTILQISTHSILMFLFLEYMRLSLIHHYNFMN